MWKCLILTLCVTGISAFVIEPHSVINPSVGNRLRNGRHNEVIQRFACPVGFFRLKRYCYYLSAGTAPWRDAYFHCKDRNATLAVLDRNGKDRMLRKYLMGEQFTKLERWIGGIYNWQQMAWEWGVTGEKMVFQNFGIPQSNQSKDQYAWHCITIDPALKYKWSPRSCIERKHYVCEVQAGRIARRRKKTVDPLAPQNQMLKSRKKGKKNSGKPQKPNRKQRLRQKMRRNEGELNTDNYWVHGVNPGSRPPSNKRLLYSRNGMRHQANRTQPKHIVRNAMHTSRGQEYGAYLGDGPSNYDSSLQSLTNPAKITNFASEEIILKP